MKTSKQLHHIVKIYQISQDQRLFIITKPVEQCIDNNKVHVCKRLLNSINMFKSSHRILQPCNLIKAGIAKELLVLKAQSIKPHISKN